MTSIDPKGTVAPGWSAVRDTFAKNFEEHDEIGAAICVYKNGDKVVDLWGGHADVAKTKEWDENTLVNVWSTTKGMAATVIARLVDQGKLDYRAPVASYWPEFADEGKDKITVGQAISHQGGICGFDTPLKVTEFYDHDKMASMLAAEKPHWEPGTRSGYHAITVGFLTGEFVRRVTDETLGSYFRKEIAEPLGADFYIGMPASEEGRVAELKAPDQAPAGGPETYTDIQTLALVNTPASAPAANTREWRAAEIPSAGGQGTASGVARVYAALANGGELDGVKVVGKEALAAATAPQIDNEDLVLKMPAVWGCGFAINAAGIMYGPNKTTYGHSGWGGSFGCADPEANIAIGYVMNRMDGNLAGDPRTMKLIDAIYKSDN